MRQQYHSYDVNNKTACAVEVGAQKGSNRLRRSAGTRLDVEVVRLALGALHSPPSASCLGSGAYSENMGVVLFFLRCAFPFRLTCRALASCVLQLGLLGV